MTLAFVRPVSSLGEMAFWPITKWQIRVIPLAPSGERGLSPPRRRTVRRVRAQREDADRKVEAAAVQVFCERGKGDVLPVLHAAHVGAGDAQPTGKGGLRHSRPLTRLAHFSRRAVFPEPCRVFGGESGRVSNRVHAGFRLRRKPLFDRQLFGCHFRLHSPYFLLSRFA